MSITHKTVRTLIPRFNVTVSLCVIITILSTQTRAGATAVSATEDFGNCFGGRAEDINLWGMVQKNEPVLIAALILIAMAGYSAEFIVERWLTFSIGRKQSLELLLKIGSALFHGRVEEAAALPCQYPKSPLAAALDALIQSNPRALQTDASTIKPSMHEWRRAIVIKTAEIKRRLWTLAAIGWSAPLVGLLYASTRIMQTCWWWQSAEGTSVVPFAAEIGHAAWGLSFSIVVAVPAIWAHKYFSAQAESIVLEMEHLSLSVIEQLVNRQAISLPHTSSARYITRELNANATRRIAD